MARGYLPPEIYQEVAEFLLGNRKYQERKHAATTISRWYRSRGRWNEYRHPGMNMFLRTMIAIFDEHDYAIYPVYIVNKLRMENIDEVEDFEGTIGLDKPSKVIKWVMNNMSCLHLAMFGIF